MPDCDVAIVGAGCAGLAARAVLESAGLHVVLIEARDRIGGRVHTLRDPQLSLPIELGAEFVHGRPPEVWEIIRARALGAYDCSDRLLHICDGKADRRRDAWLPVANVMSDMQQAARTGPDQSFAAFLERGHYDENTKQTTTSFVEGFNAADKRIIGIASLAQDREASQAISGDSSFRLFSGYDSVPHALAGSSPIVFNRAVSRIEWNKHSVTLTTRSVADEGLEQVRARRVIITLPLGVLQAKGSEHGAIMWDPVPEETLNAAGQLAFGDVMRVVMRFREAFWERNTAFADVGFFLSDAEDFPTWWSPLAVRAPMLTGWSAGPPAVSLLSKTDDEIIAAATRTLARILRESQSFVEGQLTAAYFHNWHSDPFARGAYSYVPAGALPARETLAKPVEDTLYFAGEATELDGHSATVHGAIASGRAAARKLISAMESESSRGVLRP